MTGIKSSPLRVVRTLLSIISMVAFISMVVLFAMTAGILPVPDTQPLLELGGNPQLLQHGVRLLLLSIFILGCVAIALLFIVSRFPRLYRYPVEITPQNVQVQYDLAKIMLGINQLMIAIYANILMVGIYQTRLAIPSAPFWRVSALCGAMIVANTVGYYGMAHRKK